jgi:hypothetical protein
LLASSSFHPAFWAQHRQTAEWTAKLINLPHPCQIVISFHTILHSLSWVHALSTMAVHVFHPHIPDFLIIFMHLEHAPSPHFDHLLPVPLPGKGAAAFECPDGRAER